MTNTEMLRRVGAILLDYWIQGVNIFECFFKDEKPEDPEDLQTTNPQQAQEAA